VNKVVLRKRQAPTLCLSGCDVNSLPALYNGVPVRSEEEFIVFGAPSIGQEEIDEVVDTLKSGWISTGPKTRKFEKMLLNYIGAPFGVSTNSCTAALHLVMKSHNIGPGDEVITTPMTFAASVNVIEHVGAKPVFADVYHDGFNIDPANIEAAITKKTKAIVPVHFAGLPCDLDKIYEIARKHNLVVIEDAAHAIGSEYRGKKIGSFGNPTCFSFYVTKNIATAEGGFVSTSNELLAERIKILCLHGMDLGAWQRYSKHGNKHYQVVYPGYKNNLTDIASSLGIHQLKKLDNFISIRKKYADIYYQELKEYDELILPRGNSHDRHAWHLYPVIVKPEIMRASRDEVMNALTAENIGIGVHFRAVHLHEYYSNKYGYVEGMYPNAEFIGERVFSLPLTPKMTEDDIDAVIFGLKRIINYYRNRNQKYYECNYHSSENRLQATAGKSPSSDSWTSDTGVNDRKAPVLQES